MRTILNIAILLSFSTVVFAQNPLRYFREGNRLYQDKKYEEAGNLYYKGFLADSTDIRAAYNMSNIIYKLGEHKAANEAYNLLLTDKNFNRKLSNTQKADVYHNLGNTYVRTEDYENAINAYKESLKLNPNDNDTRYNLAYALQKKRQQEQQQQDNPQEDDEIKKILEQAKRLVAQRKYQEAYDFMKKSEKKYPVLSVMHADFTNRILDVINMN
jgi:tetratricopeptide (TPR) repeat protein